MLEQLVENPHCLRGTEELVIFTHLENRPEELSPGSAMLVEKLRSLVERVQIV